jgi:hypothetical protein
MPGTAAKALGLGSGTTVTGAGVKIGIISDSFDALGTAAVDEASGALPASVQVLKDSSSGRDEGRAMAEVAHSVAGGAQIVFSAAGGSVSGLAASIASLQAAGCTIILDDVSFGNEPFYQMGDPAETAIAAFTAAGGVYFTAASNAGPNSAYEATFEGVAATLPGIGAVTAMNFGTVAAPQATESLTLAAGRTTSFTLQWAQPWGSLGGIGSSYSLGYAIYDPSGMLVKSSTKDVTGSDPVLMTSFTPSVGGAYTVAVFADSGTDPGGTFKMVANNNATATATFAGAHGSGSVFGHGMDPDAITVGAVDTLASGGTLKSEPFSAAGPGMELYSDTGAPLPTPKTLHAVDVSGPDGIETTLPASDLNPFYGTSCATPAVAAVGALMKQADPSLTAGEVKAFLESSAIAFGTDAQAGAGLVQAPAAVALARESNTTIHGNEFGTGQSAILWQNAGGSAALAQVSVDAVTGTTSLARPVGEGWSAVATGDFSGVAGHSDVLWQNRDGRLAVDLMGGSTVETEVAIADPGAAWHVTGTGDFDGDGESDIFLKDPAGSAKVLTMAGTGVTSATTIKGPGAGWSVAGIGDFDGDGQTDILWSDASGNLAAWIMHDTSVTSQLQLSGTPGAGWSVVGTGDLTGDGRADILLQDESTGALSLLGMTGAGVASRTAITANPGADWHVAGLGAFSGSGREGILYENAGTGAAMIGDVGHGQITRTLGIATPGSGWSAMLG